MKKRARPRRFTPGMTSLERRRLLTLSALWLGQDGGDYVGTEGTLVQQAPNDYQDIHFRLTGLSGAPVAQIEVQRYGGGGWDWSSAGGKNAMLLPDAADSTDADLYLEPYFADPAGTLYQAIRVTYADGSVDQAQATSTTAVDPNLRTPGKSLSATFLGQDGQDWTGATIAVGPDGMQDVHIAIANLSTGASGTVRVTAATNPPRSWETGVNPDGRWNAEPLNRTGTGSTLGSTADLFFSSDVDLTDVTLTIQVFYDHWNPDYQSYTNRSGKTDSVTIIAGATDPSLAMPQVTESDLATFSATSHPQDPQYPGWSHAAIDAASLAALSTPQSFATVRSAVLSDRHGAAWLYFRPGSPAPYTGFPDPTAMRFDAAGGTFDFPPVRSEDSSTLTLLLTFDDGSQAVSRFAGSAADLGRLAVDTRVGTTAQDVADAAGLFAALDADAPRIHLRAGTYNLDRPMVLDAPVQITADPGAVLNFVLSDAAGSPWKTSTGAIQVRASHVALDGFSIRFEGTTAQWTCWARNVIQAGFGTVDVDLAFTNLDIGAPAAAVAGTYEMAVPIMNFDDGDTGVIAGNVLKGGWIQLGAAPWQVLDNDYQGAVADTIAPSFLAVHRSFDLTIQGNHAHVVDPRGITQRFLVMGNADSGQGIDDLIAGNTIDGGIGTPATGAPAGFNNNPEIILTETYQPRFEGLPSAVSPDGFIVQLPYLRGPAARTGDVVSIVDGPHAGEWRMIAQALSPTRYLLDQPLPDGRFDIAVGRGFVNQTYRGNTIDIRGMSPSNVAIVVSGNHWNQIIEDNTFLGGAALRIGAGSSEAAFEGRYPAPWGWSRLPVFDIEIEGNTFVDAEVSLGVAHNRWADKASAGRTYLEGDFSDNTIIWTDPSGSAVTIGAGPDVSRGDPAYTLANYPWLTPEEIVLTTHDNWGRDPGTGAAATMRIYAARIDGATADDLLVNLPTSSAVSAITHGQDGLDYIGPGADAAGPDGFQDVHITLAGLPADRTISQVTITGYDGRNWSYGGVSGDDEIVLMRKGAKADLYIQPYQDENGRFVMIDVRYSDGSSSRALVDALYASATLPMPTNVALGAAPAVVSARGDNAGAGEDKLHAFDGDVRTKWLDFSSTSWIQYQFAGGIEQLVKSYSITSANDTALYPGRAPRSWVLKGSNDGVNWTILDERTNAAVTANYLSRTYVVANPAAYRIYRLDDIVSNGDPIIQIGEIRFDGAPAATSISAARGDNARAGEGAAQAFDGDVQTKWLDFSSTSWIQYASPDGVARIVSQYAITSANDTALYPGRAPKSWKLEGSNDGQNWTILDTQTDAADTADFSTRVYHVSNPGPYRYYRLNDIVSNGDPIIQIADVALQSNQVLAIAAGASAPSSSFGADAFYSGGAAASTAHPIDVTGVACPAPQAAYQSERYGDFTYTLPGLTPGASYMVRLHFSENYWWQVGRRTFDVTINGRKVLDHFDILAAAGDMYKAVVREFSATADASGRIVIAFLGEGQPDHPKVDAIEVLVPSLDLARGRPATSSSDEDAAFSPAMALDGDASTRWSSGQWMRPDEAAWLAVDLGAVNDIGRVAMNWEDAFAVDYQIQVSEDGRSWTTVRTIAGATTRGTVAYANLQARGRYVRIAMTRYNATKNYSLYNFSVYNS
ncbi:discoidin domain-containing protein [Paludisphaera mucosa]|uniref:Discoidin domain-containing protein n=1 Tax=Paludisphaera mucosa TaxID=3030827 RepID=A0ABT6FD67_9BACT|nr:discoidin domain-containing protein [Paludisphaera mucosa]MDG3005527.1 discoidin domain-containing protein [Paludisphaera mucosa]